MGFFSFLSSRPKTKDQPKHRTASKGPISHVNESHPRTTPRRLNSQPTTAATHRDKGHKDPARKHPTFAGHHRNASSPQLQLTPASATNHHAHCPQQQHREQTHPYGGAGGGLGAANLAVSMVNLAKDASALPNCNDGIAAWYGYSTVLVGTTVSIFDEVSVRLNHILTQIDGEVMVGNEPDLFTCRAHAAPAPAPANDCRALVRASAPDQQVSKTKNRRHDEAEKGRLRKRASQGFALHGKGHKEPSKNNAQVSTSVATSVVRGEYFSKVELYANSRIPSGLPPFAVYFPTWPLLCLAAQYSQSVYERPQGSESEAHVSSDWRAGTKAMVIKSVPMDHMQTIVFAVRGTASFMDWTVNLHAAPTAPTRFLDDEANLCHSGFLMVARRMVKPVGSRLRQLLEEDPSRSKYSLLITGHSAGGAVASLLYCHMLSQSKRARSSLSQLTARFKRVHCVTFGTPPISLSPLMKPDRRDLKNSVFLSFINEGDPVVRADKAYVRSLLELLASPPPSSSDRSPDTGDSSGRAKSGGDHTQLVARLRKHKSRPEVRSKPDTPSPKQPVWPVPAGTLKNAGRLVVLRSPLQSVHHRPHRDRATVEERLAEGVIGHTCRADQLEGLIWGDPAAHLMGLYAGRVEKLAVQAVTGSRK